ncbi:MAG: hypothetical protein HKO90_10620, partial [Flavobacteriaceae bacterium]|nr:hypothetical protein [Flavobacteriaceae bacterium]
MKRIAFLLLFIAQLTFSQENFGINFPGYERDRICNYYNQLVLNKPKEVRFSIVQERDALYFETNDKNWLAGLFKDEDDGIAIDVVITDRYDCDLPHPEASQIRGRLLKPVYA